jgi:Zn-dependent M16 (insulinase) family peptidase
MGIRIPAQAAFAEVGYHLSCAGVPSDGSLQVADNILSLSYLWNEIRVQGGAYGAGMRTGRSGSMVCYTYRDPSPARSLGIYAGCADFLKAYCEGDEDLDKFIISTVAKTEPLRAPGERGMAADERWFAGVTFEKQMEHRRQMLATTREKLLGWCDVFKAMSADGAVCVVANDEALKLCEDIEIFDL